jgi:hypothetical protein
LSALPSVCPRNLGAAHTNLFPAHSPQTVYSDISTVSSPLDHVRTRFVSFRFVSFRFVSFRFVSFRFVSFRFVSFRFAVLPSSTYSQQVSRLFIFTWSHSHTTLGRTPLDEGSARRRDLYLTTHNTHKRQTSMPPVGFELTIPTSARPQTHALDRRPDSGTVITNT